MFVLLYGTCFHLMTTNVEANHSHHPKKIISLNFCTNVKKYLTMISLWNKIHCIIQRNSDELFSVADVACHSEIWRSMQVRQEHTRITRSELYIPAIRRYLMM